MAENDRDDPPVGAQYVAPLHTQRDPPLQRLTLMVFAFSTIVLVLAALAGRALGRADDLRALHFDLCAERPCVLGMVPGATAWTDAAAMLARYPIDALDDKRVYTPLPGVSVETYISVNTLTVGRVYLSFPHHAPFSAAWIIQRYGAPCGVSIYGNGDLMTLRYPLLLANIHVGEGHLTMDAPVTAIRFSDPEFHFESQPDPCVDNITSRQMRNTHWQGFAPIALYWQGGSS